MFDYLYEWGQLKEASPEEDVRNYWLFHYGAFGFYRGVWFPCTVTKRNTVGAAYSAIAVQQATENQTLYPTGEIKIDDMDVFYSVFPNGESLRNYISTSMRRKKLTDIMLNGAIRRSLNTEVIAAPRKVMQNVKRAANRMEKEEVFVIDGVTKDDIFVVELPRTVDIIEKLWNSNDWAIQEISQLLGISYNPAHGKKERMLQNELLGDRDLTLMNRRKVTQRLITAATKFGETVRHISTAIDTIDRGLAYEKGVENGNVLDDANMEQSATGNGAIPRTTNG